MQRWLPSPCECELHERSLFGRWVVWIIHSSSIQNDVHVALFSLSPQCYPLASPRRLLGQPSCTSFSKHTHTHTHHMYNAMIALSACAPPPRLSSSCRVDMQCDVQSENIPHTKTKKQPNYTIRWKSLLENLIDGYTRSNRTTQDDPIFQYFQRVRRFIKQRQSTNKKKNRHSHTHSPKLNGRRREKHYERLLARGQLTFKTLNCLLFAGHHWTGGRPYLTRQLGEFRGVRWTKQMREDENRNLCVRDVEFQYTKLIFLNAFSTSPLFLFLLSIYLFSFHQTFYSVVQHSSLGWLFGQRCQLRFRECTILNPKVK